MRMVAHFRQCRKVFPVKSTRSMVFSSENSCPRLHSASSGRGVNRPRSIQSRIFCAWVPGDRCSGLQHRGVSQECSTLSTSGTSMCSWATARWTSLVPPSRRPMVPYPMLFVGPVHNRHSLSHSKRGKIRSIAGTGFGPRFVIIRYYKVVRNRATADYCRSVRGGGSSAFQTQ